MAAKVFIDGEVGTTGLQIHQRLVSRCDIELLSIPEAHRKDPGARATCLNAADAVVLCLPDAASREAMGLISSAKVKIIDASTAFRTDPDWTYGFAEMGGNQRSRIRESRRVSNPGCWPTGFIALVRPLVSAGVIPPTWPVTVHGVSGYSGGGKPMIAEFEDTSDAAYTEVPFRLYGLGLGHKHVPEMQHYAGLTLPPVFSPAVGRYRQGMIVEVPLFLAGLPGRPRPADLQAVLQEAYASEAFVRVVDTELTTNFATLSPLSHNGTNQMSLYVFGSDNVGQARLVAVLDNLGKGAAGAAVQNLNLVLGLDERSGL